MTDPTDFPEPEPELEPDPDKFFSIATLLRNLPYMAALALAIFGVAYSNFSGRPINGYWEFLAIAMGLVCIFTGWPNAPERQIALHAGLDAGRALGGDPGGDEPRAACRAFSKCCPCRPSVWCCCCCWAWERFSPAINLVSLRICFLGAAMALSIPAMTWLKQASLLLLLAGVAIVGLAVAFWPRGKRKDAA